MQPQTKFHNKALNLSKEIPGITSKQEQWAFDHCFVHTCKVMKKGVYCLACGHQWKPMNESEIPKNKCTCPACGLTLKVDNTKKRIFKQAGYFSIISTLNGHQVFRNFLIKLECQAGKPIDYLCKEITQRWISSEGKYATLGVGHYGAFYNRDWAWWTNMEVRQPFNDWYNILGTVYPSVKYIPEIKRNGFTGHFHGISAYRFFIYILGYPPAETLLKSGLIELFKRFSHCPEDLKKCWPALKICLRHHYKIEDFTLWVDYIKLLRHFKMDIRSPRYACASDYREIHDQLVRRKRREDEKRSLEKKIEKAAKEESAYLKAKGMYFGLEFTDGLLNVKVLESVAEVIREGDTLHHCVFTNEYHQKKDSLLLSARIGGEPIETIELSLRSWKVVQCRGKHNRDSEYHDRIIKLVKNNRHLIQRKTRLNQVG